MLGSASALLREVAVPGREVGMLPKKKEPKKKSVVMSLMRDMQGSAEHKLALFQKLRAAGGFANESAAELRRVENMLRTFAATEKGGG
jgi:hypothetical protein